MIQIPPLHRVRQRFPRPRIQDPTAAVAQGLAAVDGGLQAGQTVAITVGSRGIADLAVVVKAIVDQVKRRGGQPVLVPCMGSHGGATAAGQREIIESYGVTEVAMGAPIRSDMEVIELPSAGSPVPVYCDRQVAAADQVIVLNRVKPHTDYHGRYESGLMKMLAIGVGKQRQAVAIHRLGIAGLLTAMPAVARVVLAHRPVLAGVALVENAYHELAEVQVMPGAVIPDLEPLILERARALMPCLPVDELDLLVVDQIGKDISGVGMDPFLIGRSYINGHPEPEPPRIGRIIVRNLSPGSHGNGLGIGLADVTTRRVAEAIDWHATYENTRTSTFVRRAFLPVVQPDDHAALAFTLATLGHPDPTHLRLARIRDTLHLADLLLSSAALAAAHGRTGLEDLGPVTDLYMPLVA